LCRTDMNSPSQRSAPRPAVWFPQWEEVLVQVRLPGLVRQQYRTAILQYLRFCKQTRQRATVDSARQFMSDIEQQRRLSVSQLATWRAALNWFFQEAAKHSQASPLSVSQNRTWRQDRPI